MIIGEREREYRNIMRASNFAGAVVNPRRACAARVTVVGPVCVSVTQHLTSRMSNRAIKNLYYILSGIRSSKILWGFLLNDCVQELWRETQAKEPIAN